MNVFTVGVVFQNESSKKYDYLCNIEGVKSGDKVLVQTYDDAIEIANVSVVYDIKSPRATKWAFQKIDVDRNKFLIEARKEAVRLKTALASKAEELAKKRAYEELFAGDPEAVKLVDRLKELDLW